MTTLTTLDGQTLEIRQALGFRVRDINGDYVTIGETKKPAIEVLPVKSGNPFRQKGGKFGKKVVVESIQATPIIVAEFNKNHDKAGRFDTGNGGGATGGAGDYQDLSDMTADEYLDLVDEYDGQANISSAHEKILSDYTGGAFYDVNTGLRNANGNMDADARVWAKDYAKVYDTDEGFNNEATRRKAWVNSLDYSTKNSLKSNTILYRGVTDSPILKKGQIISDPAFQSSSFSKLVGSGFATTDYEKNNYLLIVKAPKGTKGIFPDALSGSRNAHEREYILPRGTKYKIDSIVKTEEGYTEAYVSIQK